MTTQESLCARIFKDAGNTLHLNGGAEIRTSHEPTHSSKSGTCVSINLEKDLYYCRSCLQGGNPVKALMELEQLSYDASVQAIKERYRVDVGQENGKQEDAPNPWA